MKLEIEIAEQELRKAVEQNVRLAIVTQTNSYGTEAYIREQVRVGWHSAVDALVIEALADSDALRGKIAAEIERKLRAQLAVAVKNAS